MTVESMTDGERWERILRFQELTRDERADFWSWATT